MSSPQVENGYTRIANEIMDALVAYRVPGEQMQCCLYILRKTYGYNKKKDMISNSQFCDSTGLKKGNVSRAIKSLVEKKVVIKSDNTRVPTYRFNKNYKQWKVLSKKQPVIKKATTVIKSDNKVLSKVMDTKDNKDNTTKDNIPEKIFLFSKQFYEYLSANGGKSKYTEDDILKGADSIDKLLRINKYDFEKEIKPALRWGVKDDFWSSQVRSLAALRKKAKNGEMKFTNLFNSYSAKNKKITSESDAERTKRMLDEKLS